jgi:hypothetical protein
MLLELFIENKIIKYGSFKQYHYANQHESIQHHCLARRHLQTSVAKQCFQAIEIAKKIVVKKIGLVVWIIWQANFN